MTGHGSRRRAPDDTRRGAADADVTAAFVAELARSRRTGAPEAVLDELRRVILAGDAPPGLAIPCDEVAALFEVSVIPVREALKTLVGEGLVEHRRRGGYTVARLTPAELDELYVVRGVLEQAALAAAVEKAGPDDHARAVAAHAELAAAIEDGDGRRYNRESRRFHLALVAPAGMHRLQAMLESAWNLTEPYQPMAHTPLAERRALHAEHEQMLAAFVVGDAEALRERAAAHHAHLRRTVSAHTTGADAEPGLG
ncbi:MAG TPA: GntR family transcriptional regulator [Pseudonocardia sp.]|jgi:DNA-binding GntR family transcriptional regulator|uniref:GntR family transcriptional regulator n=1 Tax=Pseudonocardia sp. TaxID=60912 RepID=UPI002B4B2DDB|nr:GntR family transcriptional regulator [Pseudonocardia sp.]HLU58789.1 GntR family transcriptional regulator [Pseudonocardia sp.]